MIEKMPGFPIWLMAFAISGLGNVGAAATLTLDKSSGCRLFLPHTWAGSSPRWTGQCTNGTAEGLGVIVRYLDGKAQESYFGEIEHGLMTRGVIETPDGYRSMRFIAGEPGPPDGRQQIIENFRIAARAAQAVSDHFKGEGNSASAAYYAAAAERFANQMD